MCRSLLRNSSISYVHLLGSSLLFVSSSITNTPVSAIRPRAFYVYDWKKDTIEIKKSYQVEQSEACSTLYCLVVCPGQWASVSHVVKDDPRLASAIVCELVLIQWRHPDAKWLAKQCQLLYTATTHTNTPHCTSGLQFYQYTLLSVLWLSVHMKSVVEKGFFSTNSHSTTKCLKHSSNCTMSDGHVG